MTNVSWSRSITEAEIPLPCCGRSGGQNGWLDSINDTYVTESTCISTDVKHKMSWSNRGRSALERDNTKRVQNNRGLWFCVRRGSLRRRLTFFAGNSDLPRRTSKGERERKGLSCSADAFACVPYVRKINLSESNTPCFKKWAALVNTVQIGERSSKGTRPTRSGCRFYGNWNAKAVMQSFEYQEFLFPQFSGQSLLLFSSWRKGRHDRAVTSFTSAYSAWVYDLNFMTTEIWELGCGRMSVQKMVFASNSKSYTEVMLPSTQRWIPEAHSSLAPCFLSFKVVAVPWSPFFMQTNKVLVLVFIRPGFLRSHLIPSVPNLSVKTKTISWHISRRRMCRFPGLTRWPANNGPRRELGERVRCRKRRWNAIIPLTMH